MTDPLIDDVKALLDKEKGDERILKQIYRACENDEVISNYERNYVRNLAEKYLGRISQVDEKLHIEEQSPSPIITPKPNFESQSLISSQIVHSKSKNKKIFFGIGGIIIISLVIAAVSFSGISNIEFNNTENIFEDTSKLSIKTDLSSYQKGDIISISGISNNPGKVTISIMNSDNKLVWSEQVTVKNDMQFSTLAIAGGPGWEKSGTFTIKVENDSDTESKTFSFKI